MDRGKDELDYSDLEEILKDEFFLWYEDFFIVEEEHNGQLVSGRASKSVSMATKESRLKDEIIANLRICLTKSAALAALCGSSTVPIWSRAIANFEQKNGDYHAWSKEDELRYEADLVAFLRDFRQARQQLWVDWQKRDLKRATVPVHDEASDVVAKNTAKIAEHTGETARNTAEIAENTKPVARGRDDLSKIVKRILADGKEGKIPRVKSVQTAIGYLRRSDLTPNMPYFAESNWARDFAASFAANKKTKSKDGVESFWRSIRRQCSGKSKVKKTERMSAVPILYKGAEHLADDME